MYKPGTTGMGRKTKDVRINGETTISAMDIIDGMSLSIVPQKAGTLKINIIVEQSGQRYVLQPYTISATKYENPFSSISVGKVKLTKCYKKYPVAGCLSTNCYPLSQKTRRYIQGVEKNGKTIPREIKIKMKKGYKLVNIKIASWGNIYNTEKIKNGSKLSRKNGEFFNEVYITYKDKKGKKWVNLIWL